LALKPSPKATTFPGVTLVGIIWADHNLHFPLFNASETTLQKLIQVAGRAGRQSDNSLVIAQTMQDHPIFDYLKEEDYLNFCTTEFEYRKETSYPPFGRLIQLELKHTNSKIIEEESKRLFRLDAKDEMPLASS